MTAVSQSIEGYQAWIERKYEDGWSIWFCTVQFNHFRQAKTGTIDTMQHEVEHFYIQILTNIIRNPCKVPSDQLPMLIGAPDMPVFKYKPTTRLADMLPNNGMHYHFVLLVPQDNRLNISLNQHVIQNMRVFLGNQRKVSKFDVRPFVPVPGKSIADYVLKHIKRSTFTSDDILILPRSRSELKIANRTSHEHSTPDELRLAFRRLLAAIGAELGKGKTIELWNKGPGARMVLSIVPHLKNVPFRGPPGLLR